MKKNIPLVSFFFIRHGQTDWNLKGMIQGWTDIPLNETGHAQARSAISILSGKGISRIVSSPLIRAHKTAKIINAHLNVPLLIIEGLRERSLGALEGTVKTSNKDNSVIAMFKASTAPFQKDRFQTNSRLTGWYLKSPR